MFSSSRCTDCQRSIDDDPSSERKRKYEYDSDDDHSRQRDRHEVLPTKFTRDKYIPLPKTRGSIRLLKLFPGNFKTEQVDCELIPATLDENNGNVKFEALSWSWGTKQPTAYINIRQNEQTYAKYVSPDLVSALRALRNPRCVRHLWVDAVCINQEHDLEKNHQVEMMSEIYGKAEKVCVWLGDGDESSRVALKFIKKDVLQLQNFDDLCQSRAATEKWSALLDLMQRPWFSRRWVVQEIALARKAVIYCGKDRINWNKFAIAVELFVEVETATHRLSEVMKKDPRFYHVPGWFEYVSALGASLLVDATGRLFRDYKLNTTRPESDSLYNTEDEFDSDSGPENPFDEHGEHRNSRNMMKYKRGPPLLNLEYLVSNLSIFDVSMEHDTIYALLAIARDTNPSAGDEKRMLEHTEDALQGFMQKKKYKVEYQRPYVDVCKEFVNFCIERSISTDPTRALDVICRPWATEKRKKPRTKLQSSRDQSLEEPVLDSSPTDFHGLSSELYWKLVKLPKRERCGLCCTTSAELNQRMTHKWLRYCRGETRLLKMKRTELSKPEIWTDFWRTWSKNEKQSFWNAWSEILDQQLPTWIPELTGAAFAMLPHAGAHTLKMARKNSDSLVGFPSLTQRNYNAAETKRLNPTTLKFRKRPSMGKYSMYVQGFVLDKIKDIQDSSQSGSIPKTWADVAGWTHIEKKPPPDEFWRTLVADRGRDGRNPPVYYSRACQESFLKGGHESGSVNTTDLINNERCSVVAQFCRRVQSVIWNRSLVMTTSERLGLVGRNVEKGDLICILYGCSVPVVLRKSKERKSEEEIDQEINEEIRNRRLEILNRWKDFSKRAQAFRGKREEGKASYAKWEDKRREEWKADESWAKKWRQRQQHEIDSLKRYKVLRQSTELSTDDQKWRENWEEGQLETLKRTIFGDDFDDLAHYRSILHKSPITEEDIEWLAEWDKNSSAARPQAEAIGESVTPDQMDPTKLKQWVDRVLEQWKICRLKEILDTYRDRDHGDTKVRDHGDAKVESFLMDDKDWEKYDSFEASQNHVPAEDRWWHEKQKSRLKQLRKAHGQEKFELLEQEMRNPWWNDRRWWTKSEYWEMEEQKEKQRQAYEELNEDHKAKPWEHNPAWWEQWKILTARSDLQNKLRVKTQKSMLYNYKEIKSRLEKIKQDLGIPATMWASFSTYYPICSMALALLQKWRQHQEYLQSRSLMEKDREFNAWKKEKRHEKMQAQRKWEEEKRAREAKKEQERKTEALKKRRAEENSQGPTMDCESLEDDKSPKEEWGEPFPNWNEFELFLKYGRRWRHGRRWKIALKQFKDLKPGEDSPQNLTDPVSTTPPAAENQPPPATQEQPPREPALPKPSLAQSGKYNPAVLIHQPRTPNEEEVADNIRKKLYSKNEDGWWSYEFLGESYIHGMMDGEAMAFQNKTGQPAQVFELI